jgi:exodeoxyribonuclease-3
VLALWYRDGTAWRDIGRRPLLATIKIVSWNVNGIRAAHRKGFLDWFEEERPDILCIQETKANEDQFPSDLRAIDGYHKFYSSAEKKGYSGVALYTAIEPVGIEPGFGIERFDSEGRTLQADMGDFVLFNVYFPNGRSSDERLGYKLEFYDAFLDHIGTLRSQGRNIIVCGDVNTAHKPIDLARPKENEKISGFLPIEREWIDKLVERGYVDTFRMFNEEPGQYSWWTQRANSRARNVGWRLDYFFVNEEFRENVKSAGIHQEVMGSDHCPVSLEVEIGS